MFVTGTYVAVCQQNPMTLFDHEQYCQIAAIAVQQRYTIVEFEQTTIVPPCAI
jgi:hypothetical protein